MNPIPGNPLFGRRPMIVAHRGASRAAPENTLAALSAAMETTHSLGGIEIDVQVSADGHVVLFHDQSLAKAGRPNQRVDELTLGELLQLDVGSWHSAHHCGEPMPTLRRVLREYRGQVQLFVELKMYGDLDRDPLLRCRRTDALLEDLLELGRVSTEQLNVLSFDAQSLRLMSLQAPHLRYVLNITHRLPSMRELEPEVTHLSAVCVHVKILNPDFVAGVRRFGLPVLVFTCNEPGEVNHALLCGVDAILSDDPAWLASYLEGQPRSRIPTAS